MAQVPPIPALVEPARPAPNPAPKPAPNLLPHNPPTPPPPVVVVEQPQPQPRPDRRPRVNPGTAVEAPVPTDPPARPLVAVIVRPPDLKAPRVERTLPGTVGDVCVGGRGRHLILSLPKERKLAVFDANEGKVVKYLSVADDSPKFAACQDKLVVLLSASNIWQRYSLETFEREVSLPGPQGPPVTNLLMGAGSAGPLASFQGGGPTFWDPYTLKPLAGLTLRTFGSRENVWRISGDGRVLTTYSPNTSPQGHTIYSRAGPVFKAAAISDLNFAGLMAPGPEGRFVYTARGVLTPEGKPVGKLGSYSDGSRFCLAAAEGETFHLRIDARGFPHGGAESGPPDRLYLHAVGDDRPIGELEGVEVPHKLNTWGREPIPADSNLFLIPSAKSLVALAATRDRLVVHRVDVDALLEKSSVDYLVALSRPPVEARRGVEYRYDARVKSKKGGVKFKLESSPPGMAVSAEGVVTWKVPADFEGKSADVILSFTDKSEQEVFQSFTVAVPDP